MLRNTPQSFGSLSKLFHWLIVVIIALQYYLVWGQDLLAEHSPLKPSYTLLHKSFGLTLFTLALLFVFWRLINPKPQPTELQPRWKQITATAVQHSLLTLIVLMPTLGYLMGCASGKIVSFFGLFNLPVLIGKNEMLGKILFQTHVKLGWVLFILISLHALAALHHHFILKDNTLKRML